MPHLLDLSDELVLEIVSHLRPTPPLTPESPSNRPFFIWANVVLAASKDGFKLASVLRSVALVCRRLHNVAVEALYRHIPLSTEIEPSKTFISGISQHPHLSNHIRSVDILCGRHEVMVGIKDLFWLPNIHTICVRNCGPVDWHSYAFQNLHHVRTSPVQILRLIACRLGERPLCQIVSWPKALKEFWYEAAKEVGGVPDVINCTFLQRALAIHAECLEKFVLTTHEIFYNVVGGAVDLRNYSRLRSLCSQRPFLLNYPPDDKDNNKAWERLPKSLQELEVGYLRGDVLKDDIPFSSVRIDWLIGILDKMWAPRDKENPKGVFTPSLERVRLVLPALPLTPEQRIEFDDHDTQQWAESDSDPDFDPDSQQLVFDDYYSQQSYYFDFDEQRIDFDFDEQRGVGTPGSRLPVNWMRSFIRAGVSFSIFTLFREYYRYTVEGGKGFDDVWEDVWDAREGMDIDP
ncbi:hypothetical protein F5Y06DRAFT_251606 [Hypoxylon sp. FL0890]|nr:hypothetical protein F5Y06DRAFT_251606 [Hypoxylon sp. FL0890]